MYIEHSLLVQYFAHSFTTRQVLTPLRVTSTRKVNAFSNETCLNVKHQHFFQHIVQIYLNTYWHTPVRPYERRDCCDRWISRWNNTSARSFFTNNTFSSTSKLFTPNMYCWSCKTLVTIYLMYLRMNGIWEKSFCTHKCITEHCSFQR